MVCRRRESDGALVLSGINTADGVGRAYIFQYIDGALAYGGASEATLTFDLKADGALVGTALQLQVEVPGAGTLNFSNLETQGLNDAGWTSYSFDLTGITGDGIFRLHFNMAAGAFVGAGGTVMVDNVVLTAGEAVATVEGCIDANASNYDADATDQAFDQYGNIQCVYASCDDVPEDGCIYADAFGAFNDSFNADQCVSYGGSPCETAAAVSGCLDANASNYDADATEQAYDQYGNLQCVFASCDDVPEDGCIYADAFGAFNDSFNADQCVSYGGTPCE